MKNEQVPLTQEGRKKLEKELLSLETEKRKKSLARIKAAREFCDFSEDAEFEEALKEQASIEERISELKQKLKHATEVVIDQNDRVMLGHSVTVQELPNGKEATYTIVGADEAEPFEGKISNESPMATSLLGKQVNEVVSITTPGGNRDVKIIAIN